MLGSLFGAMVGANAISSMLQSDENRTMNRIQFQQNRQLMQEQAQLQQQQWDNQFQQVTQYNSPENQLALKQAAGLNPLFSEGDFTTSASPSGSVSLPSVSAPDAVQYGSLLSSVFENLFRFKETQLDEQRVSNETKKTDSDIDVNKANIVNSTNSTNSAMRVDAAKVKELLSQKELNEEEKKFVEQQTAASKAQVQQKWKELNLTWQSLGLKAREIANQEYTSKWQESVGRINARSNAIQAESAKTQSDIANKTYEFGIKKYNKDYLLKLAEFSKQCNNQNIDNFIKLVEAGSISVAGTKWTKGSQMAKAATWCEAFVNNMDKLDNESFNKCIPVFLDQYNKLEMIELSPSVPKENSYNPAPWLNE